jgi:septation ring formation regulator EzrA
MPVTIDVQLLMTERDRIRETLRELESEQRKLEAELKALRQKEIQAKREIEALSVLIDISESRSAPRADKNAETSA